MQDLSLARNIQPLTDVHAEVYVQDRKLRGFLGSLNLPGQISLVVPGLHPVHASQGLQLRGQFRDAGSFPVDFKGGINWAGEREFAGQTHTIFCVDLDASSNLPYAFLVRNLLAS